MKNNGIVLVTGGLGMIGGEVVKQLLNLGYIVRIVDKKVGASDLEQKVETIIGDLADKNIARQAFKDVKYCIHLASAIGGLEFINDNPATILSENNQINSSVFEAAARASIQRIVFISSGMVFESSQNKILAESDLKTLPLPKNYYALSKLVGEAYCKAYLKQYGINYSIARLFNVYGGSTPGKYKAGSGHVIQELYEKIKKGQYPLEIFGSGKQTRCFTHVTDAAAGIIECLVNLNAQNEDFNISSEEEIRILDLAKVLWKYEGRREEFRVVRLKKFSIDVDRRVPSVAKAKDLLKWSAKISLADGIKNTFFKKTKHPVFY